MGTHLTSFDQIWELHAQTRDRQIAADYAERTVPWTFNRMMLVGRRGLQERAINISKGIAAQEMLRQAFQNRGKQFDVQLKSHRADDLFDFQLPVDGEEKRLDFKTINYYTDYLDGSREPFSPELIIANRAYAGPDWRYFFPMMIPHTQIKQAKEVYCFAIASSVDPRRHMPAVDVETRLCAFPFEEYQHFFGSKRLCLKREDAGKGFFIRCCYNPSGLFATEQISLVIVGEWQGQMSFQTLLLQANQPTDAIGPFSIIDSFKISYPDYQSLSGSTVAVECVQNDYLDPLRNANGENMNKVPSSPLCLCQDDFRNIMLPIQYTLFVLGWITKPDFLRCCRSYPSWVWPNDKVNKFHNQSWSQITQRDENTIRNVGFDDCISQHPTQFRAGWMKTSGYGNGACCYVFPNVHHRGGINETNLYALPRDLNIMDDLL